MGALEGQEFERVEQVRECVRRAAYRLKGRRRADLLDALPLITAEMQAAELERWALERLGHLYELGEPGDWD